MSDRHFRVRPGSRFQVWHISGGRTSGYMLRRLLDDNGGVIPKNAEAVFCNTGKECAETLDFLRDMQDHWGIPITWIEFHTTPRGTGEGVTVGHRVVDYDSASRNGEPFEMLLRREKMLPSAPKRFCTRELKRNTANRYFATKGLPPRKRVEIIGIRADESRRVQEALMAECRVDYPLVHAGVTHDDVLRYWAESPFDLRMDAKFGNCDLCFLKGRRAKLQILQERPEVGEWWQRQEETVLSSSFARRKADFRFERSHSIRQLREDALSLSRQPGLFEQQEKADEDLAVSCFCGD